MAAYLHDLLIQFAVFVMLAESLNLLVGRTGVLSLGHAGLWAVGAYAAALVAQALSGVMPGMPVFALTLVVAGLCAMLASLLVAIPSARLEGDYCAIATLAFSEMIRVLILNSPSIGGARGWSGIPANTTAWGAFIVAAVSVVIIRNFLCSSYGRALAAVRDDPIAAAVSGVDPYRARLMAFGVSGFFVGVSGAIFAQFMTVLSPANFEYTYSIVVLLMVVVGGIGNLTGAIVGTLLVVIAPEALRFLGPRVAELRLGIYAIVLLSVIAFRPRGLMGGPNSRDPLAAGFCGQRRARPRGKDEAQPQ